MPKPTLTETVLYWGVYWTAFYTATFGWRFRVSGREKLPRQGPALLVSNHQSFVDPLLIGLAAKRPLTYLARHNLWSNRVLGWFVSRVGAVPIDRGFGKEGLLTVIGELDQGNAVLMFPEGERTRLGDLQPLKPGISLLLKRIHCPIVPVAIAGAYDAWPRHEKIPAFDLMPLPTEGRSISVAFGTPFDSARYHNLDRDAMLSDLHTEIEATLAEAEKHRG